MNTSKKTLVKGKKTFPGRVYREQDATYLSVTSIIHPEGIDFPEEQLKQYGSRGSIVHDLVEHYILHHRVGDPYKISTPVDIDNVVNGGLGLKWEDCNYVEFFQMYGESIEFKYIEQKLINKKYGYAGRTDGIGTFDGELAIFDWKTAGNYTPQKRIDYFMQLSAYAYCITPIPKKLVIIPLNPKSERGFDEPIVETNVQHYFELFLERLEYVKDNYLPPV